MSPEGADDQLAATTSLIDEIKALRDSSEELLILLEHIWQNREDLRFKVSVVVTDESRDAIAETICCYECDTDSPTSLAQALHDGWIDISCGSEEHPTNYVGWCPACQRAYEEESRRLNTGPVHPQAVKETGPTFEQNKQGTPAPVAEPNPHVAEARANTAKEQTVESLVEESSPPASDSTPEAELRSAPSPQLECDVLNHTDADAPSHALLHLPSEEYRKNTPLLTRMYLQRHMADIVRVIGYDFLPRDAALERIKPLIERYSRETIEPAVNELLDVDIASSGAMVRLKDQVRQFARGILGPPPTTTPFADTAVAGTKDQGAADEKGGRARSASAKPRTKTPTSISRLGSLRALTFTRREMILEFREHLEKQGIPFEQIDNVTRPKYTDKHIGALDFIVRASGEPPELVAVRRKLTTTQLHDLAEWQAIVGQGASVSVVWLYVDGAGKTLWEVASGKIGDVSAEGTGD